VAAAFLPDSLRPRSTAKIFGHPIYPMLVPFPLVCFIGALVTDIVYSRTELEQWSNFSGWLIFAGLGMGVLAGLAGMIDYWGNRAVRAQKPALPHMLLNLAVFALEVVNALVHSRDGWTAVVPTGLTLSAIAAVLLAISAWLGGSLSYVRGVGVSDARR
jgi:uncharacterized membrane protein